MMRFKLNIARISIDNNFLNYQIWQKIISIIQDTFDKSPIAITICKGKIITPSVEEREMIIEESHCSPIGGHKGVTKTYNRIRKRYF